MSLPGTAEPVAASLFRRLRRREVDVDLLHDVVQDLLPSLDTGGLQVRLVDSGSLRAGRGGPELVVQEAERVARIGLVELAEQMTLDCVVSSVDGLGAALRRWISRRPVTDATAAVDGVAVLDWTDGRQEAIGWSVVVPRSGALLPWSPSPSCDAPAVHRTRSAALGRSFAVPVALRLDGRVALWSCAPTPALATAVLVDPGRMRRAATSVGLPMRRAHVVVTPGRPVAGADVGLARRLAGDTPEPVVVLPWRELADLPWCQ